MTSWAIGAVLLVCGCAPNDDLERVGQSEERAVVCGSGATVAGIDVSYYQGKVDWKAVSSDGKRFAIARINDGSFMDPEFDANWKGIQDAGMVRGAYQFFRSYEDPVAQADLALSKMGALGPGDLPPVLDVEETDGATPNQMAAKITAWAEHVAQKTGRKPMIYSGNYFWDDSVNSSALKSDPYWIPQYTNANCPDLASAWSDWTLWQYSSTVDVAGISGGVDADRFNGDELALQDLAGNGYRATIVSLDWPKQLAAGATGTVKLVLNNAGARSWTGKTQLATTVKRDHPSAFQAPSWVSKSRVLAIAGAVKSGDKATLQFSIVAPAKPGKYVEHFNLVEKGAAWFSDTPPGGGPPDDAIALAIEVVSDPNGAGGNGGAGGSGGSDAVSASASGGGSATTMAGSTTSSSSGASGGEGGANGTGGGSAQQPGASSGSCAVSLGSAVSAPVGGGLGWIATLAAAALTARARRRPARSSAEKPASP